MIQSNRDKKMGPMRSFLPKFFVFMIGLLLSMNVQSQGWELTFGGEREEEGHAVIQTIDRGYAVAGFTQSFISDEDRDTDIYLIRTDVDGTVIWEKAYDEAITERGYGMIEDEKGNFLIVGDILEVVGNQTKGYLLKVDKTGKFLWSKRFGDGQSFIQFNSITAGIDGGYLLIGNKQNPENAEDEDIYLVRVDDEGNFLWEKTFGTERTDRGNAIITLEDGYAFVGNSKNGQGFDNDIVLYKVDKLGDILWDRRISTGSNEEGNDLIRTRDGDIAVAGLVNNNSDAYILKYSSEGNQLWARSIGEPGLAEVANGIIEKPNGQLIITGIKEVNASNINVLIGGVDANGTNPWMNLTGDVDYSDFGIDIEATHDGGFIIAGYNALFQNFINDVRLIKTDGRGNTITDCIRGKVMVDDCNGNMTDGLALEGWIVEAVGRRGVTFGTTDKEGNFSILVDTGTYQVNLIPINSYWQSCNLDGYTVDFTEFYDTTEIDFPVIPVIECPYMEVDISTPFLAVCSDIVYTVNYCNLGTATATDAYVEVNLDEELSFVSASLPVTSQNGNIYSFDLGNVPSTVCGSFTINTTLACEGIANGQAALASATVFPDTLCSDPDPDWDMSSIIVDGNCVNDSIQFRIKNVGDGDMQNPRTYFVVEQDVVIFRSEPFRLNKQQELNSPAFRGTGATYRIIAQQSEGHPGRSNPTIYIEGCVEEGQPYTTGLVTQFPEDDQDPYISVDVQEIIGSSNTLPEMRGYPKGYQGKTVAQNTDLTYTILFQNTGTDTINRVVIRDTLSPHLDITSVIPGASSHPYDFEIYDEGILKITLDEIQLQPGGSVEEASYGFVKFRIAQRPNIPLGTVIENSAAVFFDYVAPAFTNTVTHEVGCVSLFENCIITDTDDPNFVPGLKIKVYPNPFNESTTFELDGKEFNNVDFKIYDIAGRLLRTEGFKGNIFEFHRGQLSSGLYFYQLETEGRLISSGKVIVR